MGSGVFFGSESRKREGVDWAFELLGQSLMDQALAGHSGEPLEGGRDHLDPEMGFALRAGSGVTRVPCRFVHHLKACGIEGLIELGDQLFADGHSPGQSGGPMAGIGLFPPIQPPIL